MNSRLKLFCALLCVLPLASVHAGYSLTPNAAISGHNKKKISGGLDACKKACDSERSFVCKSFDYDKRNGTCDLSDKSAQDVGGLKTNYEGNPYDHYAKTSAARGPMTANYRAYELIMDCYNASMRNTGSKNSLGVVFVTSSGQSYQGRKIMQPSETCSQGNKIVYRSPQIALPNQDTISKVVVSATGQDALWANKVQIHQYDKGAPNTGFKHLIPGNWDTGHGKGYCLSLDRGDNRDAWTAYVAGGCTPKMTFQIGRGAKAH
ncbi:PAN/Apple domain-containing protein [Thiorhodococcus minor]|uniref:Apple domain-containing protein n=1 Tax=Thiorhodococcus minor TaxID=57489 RepID=A0A6M0K283_9GAMM|nr:PAN/Apple domain-containing protein [Thiorhodococcus minor]NEV63856.1 hypothetical protein [Thiorhodococcus minor]